MYADDLVTRTVYSTDNSIYQVEPEAVAVASSGVEIASLLRRNHESSNPSPVVARGGGTGTNGQSLTDGLVVDVKRGLNRIVSVDPDARTAVVEPGVVTAELNAHLAPMGLHWAPHTSTLNRATVGGMISTDAAGKGSLVHGRANRHVLALDVVLSDGTPWRAEPVSIDEAERRAGGDDRGSRLWRSLLDLPISEGADFALPELARGFSGYGIDRFRRDGLIDPLALLVGAEGTLAVITSAVIRLTPLPVHTRLVVASYRSFDDALRDALDLRATNPTAIETFDERTLETGRNSPAWPALGRVVDGAADGTGSVLLLEYTGDDVPDLEPVMAALGRTGRSTGSAVLDEPAERADAWKVRADAVGLLAKLELGTPEKSQRPTAFVEDCAVPVDSMCEFIADFRGALDDFGVEYAMFGHADVGCVHVRPALDTVDFEDERLVRAITDRVVEIVASHGGVLWGEHGRGFRGESVETYLSESTIELMRRVKTAFDPDDVLNPGKLYRPLGGTEPIVRLDEAPLRGHANREVPVELRRSFDSAFACNGNGLCHHYDAAEVMCPSYKATGDPALSPKGRADLLRRWLVLDQAGPSQELDDFGAAVAGNLHQCLSCSACSGRCPVEVDIPEMKSRFLERFHSTRRRPLAHGVMSRFEQLARVASRVGPLARLGAKPAGAALGLVDLPVPGRGVGSDLRSFEGSEPGVDVVILPDVFTSVIEPETFAAAAAALSAVGYEVRQADFVASGKYDHVKGRRKQFRRAVGRQRRLVESILAAGAVPVVVEPATGLLHGHEYVRTDEQYPAGVRHLAELLADRADRLTAVPGAGRAELLGHCTERATRPGLLGAWRIVLEAAGYRVEVPSLGCCGMAGIFGHERDNHGLSRAVWERSWANHVAAAGDDVVQVATGFSCRSQAKRFAATELAHPVHLLASSGRFSRRS